MKFEFPGRDNVQAVVGELERALAGRRLGSMVNLAANGNGVLVSIKKMGTSTLTFRSSLRNGSLFLDLSEQKIALTHLAFQGEVLEKIVQLVESCGGKYSE